MDQSEQKSRTAPPGWVEALERGRADVAAGRIVPAEKVVADLHASLVRAEARKAAKATDAA